MYQPELGLIPPSPNEDVVNVPLFLPSSLSLDIRMKCSPKLVTMEKDLRLAQCYDTLSSLQLHLHSKSWLLKDKYVNICNQGPNTKLQELLNRVSAWVLTAADQYTTAFLALNALNMDPGAQWQTELFVLRTNNIHGMSELSLPNHLDPEHVSAILARSLLSGGAFPERNHALSWIWRGAPTSADVVGGYNEGLSFLHI